ncbi:MAG TPA: hypothetical protein VFH27_11710, partial [Longimicrobiaceae bacterium]|nr:hypothetical protein [Longimicrobiaceae bacterium]
ALSPLLVGKVDGGQVRTAAWVLAAYLAVSAVSAAIGTFPVPLVGIGMSPVVGFWLGCGSLVAVSRRSNRAE